MTPREKYLHRFNLHAMAGYRRFCEETCIGRYVTQGLGGLEDLGDYTDTLGESEAAEREMSEWFDALGLALPNCAYFDAVLHAGSNDLMCLKCWPDDAATQAALYALAYIGATENT